MSSVSNTKFDIKVLLQEILQRKLVTIITRCLYANKAHYILML